MKTFKNKKGLFFPTSWFVTMNTALLSAYSSSLVPALYKYHRVDGSEVFPSGFPASHETLNRHNRPQLSDQLLLTLFGQVHSDDSLKHQTFTYKQMGKLLDMFLQISIILFYLIKRIFIYFPSIMFFFYKGNFFLCNIFV